jgi:signal transduction histidine kinase
MMAPADSGHSSPGSELRLRRLVHELNTPVGVSAMAASMLPAQIDSLVAELDAPTLQRIDTLLDEWRETVALVQSSLQLCVRVLGTSGAPHKLGSGEPLPLMDLQDTLQRTFSLQLARRPELQVSCHLHLAPGLQVHGDSAAWQQVVGNLVANSLLHGFDGRGHGTIQIAAALLPGKRMLLHYYDDGRGLSEEAHARLFEDGFSTRLGRGGQGLGMGIVQELVHSRMGGRLEVHRPAKGVHISIEAPC